ncbi:hypothetical protein EJV47_22925 [Hymenobacter gummosus]|uniref:Nucleotidyltransferase domain-containing protein n=1 Tax=Hymenobacter gummosus TaxID=1776032 RepID=A0A431TX43_9BACT|nr:hypothetical protein [Hymenobacter gummosus]RTQ46015.1 hypothetical protein EJV47_22925 [Hymenobacter gummosus]
MIPAAHQQFVHHAVAVLSRTPGIVGVAIGGSWQEQALDEFSDLDLVLVLDPAAAPRLLAERPAVAASLGRLLECFTGEHVGEPRLLICLYDEPLLHVDLKFVALPDRPGPASGGPGGALGAGRPRQRGAAGHAGPLPGARAAVD